MTEITSYEQFKGSLFYQQCSWLGQQLGITIIVDLTPRQLDGVVIPTITLESEKAIKQAMIGRGYSFSIHYDSETKTWECFSYPPDGEAYFVELIATESEAVIHTAAKALLGGK